MFLGIDPSNGSVRPWAWAVLDAHRTLVDAGCTAGRAGAWALAVRLRPAVVAVDAPLGLPRGMDCLEAPCPCRPVAPLAGRACERELARRGMGLFFTTKRSLIKRMVYEAIALSRALKEQGIPVIEVYPYSLRRLLLGRHAVKKQSVQGQRLLREALTPLVAGLERLPLSLGHDGLDAVVSALVGWLWARGLTEALGEPEEGVLHIPVDGWLRLLG